MQKNKSSARAQVSVTGQTQKTILPQVSYHPSIQTGNGAKPKTILPQVSYHPSIQTGNGAKPKTSRTTENRTNQTQKTRPGDEHPTQRSQHVDNPTQAELVPTARPYPGAGQKTLSQTPDQKQNKRLVQATATDPGPSQKPDQVSNRACPRPEQVRLGLQVERAVVKEVEVLTRGQRTNQEWFSWRRNRITASVAHSIAHCRFVHGKSKTPPTSYLTAITGEGRRVQTRAMSWGVNMEAEAVRRYQRLKSSALGRLVTVQDCGLFIDTQRPWLAASPDGIVTYSQTGQRLLCLEVKCPFKHRQRRVEDACRDDPRFCLEIQDSVGREAKESPVYHLKTSHSYFTQIQCQLAVTGLQQADLVVFTTKETAIVPVTFDPLLWEETVSRLEMFYRNAVLPHLREKQQQETSTRWTPEL